VSYTWARRGTGGAGGTHGEQFEERILEHAPLLVLVGDHGDVDLAQILGEQQNQTHRSAEKKKEEKSGNAIRGGEKPVCVCVCS